MLQQTFVLQPVWGGAAVPLLPGRAEDSHKMLVGGDSRRGQSSLAPNPHQADEQRAQLSSKISQPPEGPVSTGLTYLC